MLRDIKLNPNLYNGKNIVAITFDDGYKSDYEIVYPLLKKYNVPATLFIVGSFIGKDRFMTMEQFKAVSKSNLVEIGNHSFEKHILSKADLAKEFDEKDTYNGVLADFIKNGNFIYNTIGKRPTSLSYPYGVYNDKADQYFKQNGILVSVSTNPKNDTQADIKLPLNRINRSNNDTIYRLVLDFWN
jgi:peptidoglycan/xylan/chitin deacetylase (PgdA/CDA1 family)